MLKTIKWIAVAACAAGTAMWAYNGITAEGDAISGWLNGWMVAPILLFCLVPTLFTIDRAFGDADIFGDHTSPPKEFAGAAIGMGTVVETQRTGLSINDQPQLEIAFDVETTTGHSFRGFAKQIVDLTELSVVQPGAILPVRYLPDSTKVTLATDASQAELQSVLNRVQLAKGDITPNQLRIAEQGVEGQAVVLAMTPTGEIRGTRSVISVTLRVTRPDGSTFDLTQEKPVHPRTVPEIQPGAIVRVKYLPQDESEVSVLTALVK